MKLADIFDTAVVAGVAVAASSFAAGYFLAGSRAPAAAVMETTGKSVATDVSSGSAPAAAAAVAAPAVKDATKPAVQKAVRTAADVLAAEQAEDESLEDGNLPEDVQLKLVVLVRSDLNMSKGKIAAQVGHAVLGAYRIAQRLVPEYVKAWLFRAQAKITLKVEDEDTMDAVAAAAREAGLPVCVIEDAGRTEVEPGTRTVCGIGPAPKAEIDAITGPKGKFPLKLLT